MPRPKGRRHLWGYHGEAPGGPIEVCKRCGVSRFNRNSVEPCPGEPTPPNPQQTLGNPGGAA